MRWADNLYTTEKTNKHLSRIMRKTRHQKIQPGIWFLTIASNENDLLDFFHSAHYMQPLFQNLNPDIVGVAESEDAAKDLVVKIAEDMYQTTGAFDVRSYFRFQE